MLAKVAEPLLKTNMIVGSIVSTLTKEEIVHARILSISREPTTATFVGTCDIASLKILSFIL